MRGRSAGRPAVAGTALPGATQLAKKKLRVRKHPADMLDVRGMHFHRFLQMAHALGRLRAHQVPLAGVRPRNFPARRHLKPFGGAPMRLQFQFYFGALVIPHESLNPFLFRVRRFVSGAYCRGRPCRDSGSPLRRQQRHQNIRFHPGPELNQRVIRDIFQKAIHFGAAHFLVSHFAAAMEDHGLNLVTFTQEPDDLVLADLVIVLGGRRPKFHFLELRAFLVLALLVRLLIELVKKFAVIGDLADGRISRGRNLHQVKAALACHADGLKRLHHSQLTAIIIYDTNFARANAIVNARAFSGSKTPFSDKPTSGTPPSGDVTSPQSDAANAARDTGR
jgi:hypothetical protein